MPRFFGRELFGYYAEHKSSVLGTHSKLPSYTKPVEIEFAYELCRLAAQLFVLSSLHNSIECLFGFLCPQTLLRPAMSFSHRLLHIMLVGDGRRAFIEGKHNIRAKHFLLLNRFFRPKKNFRAVYIRSKKNSFFSYF